MTNTNIKAVKEVGLKSVFTFIVNGLFAAFFISSVFITFKEKKIIAGLFYFILAVLAVVPHRFLKVTQGLKVVILIILFSILATLAAKGDPVVEQKYENYKLKQEFNLTFGDNTFSMAVKEMKYDASISIAEEIVTTSGYFVIVTGDVKNLNLKAENFKFTYSPELKDSQNRVYSLYGEALRVGELQPGVAKEVSYVFEIPKDAAGLVFIVKDKTDIAKSVDLGR